MGINLKRINDVIIIMIISVFSLFCLLPFVLVLSGSLSNEADIVKYGYGIIPRNLNFSAYHILFQNSGSIINAYKVTISVTVFGTIASLLVNTMMGYTLSRRSFRLRKAFSFYAIITLLFNGGIIPWYVVCVNILQLRNQWIGLVLPYIASGWNIMLMRNFLMSIPEEMHESAKIDGASEYRIFASIILPLAKPALATIGLFTAIGYWNDWWLGLMLIDKQNLRPLQLILRSIVSNVEFLATISSQGEAQRISSMIPREAVRMAVCIVVIGPLIILYPFLQKYFIKGIMVGAVKE